MLGQTALHFTGVRVAMMGKSKRTALRFALYVMALGGNLFNSIKEIFEPTP
jgi:hypothetical protein